MNKDQTEQDLDQETSQKEQEKEEAPISSKKQIEILKKKIKKLEFKNLELLADKENLRKGLEKEKTEILKYRANSFLRQIIPTIEMMEKALKNPNVSPEIASWLKGFEMIFNNLEQALIAEGVVVKEILPGEYYDENLHHALEERSTNKYGPGQIIEAYGKAYLLHDRLLRPANVIVAKRHEEKNLEKDQDKTKKEG